MRKLSVSEATITRDSGKPLIYEATSLYKSTGTVRYGEAKDKVTLEVDQGISDYYRSFLPKAYRVNRPMHAAHISIVRKQVPASLEAWGLHEGEICDFYYYNEVHNCPTYYWINAFCVLAEQIRIELGLPVYDSERAPEGFRQSFHITIGNNK